MGGSPPLARVFTHDADDGESAAAGMPVDAFNDPYARKAAILAGLGLGETRFRRASGAPNCELVSVAVPRTRVQASLAVSGNTVQVQLQYLPHGNLDLALAVHGAAYVRYVATAWDRWCRLAPEKRCRFFRRETESSGSKKNTNTHWSAGVPALVPPNFTSHNTPNAQPGVDVHAQTCWYHTDTETPMFAGLVDSLAGDMRVLAEIVRSLEFDLKNDLRNMHNKFYYALTTHPGHHAAKDNAGGYCYLNNAAVLAKALTKSSLNLTRVAILDVDYHAGNGTCSLFYHDPDVLVVSIHASPEGEYPWNSGYATEQGSGRGLHKTINVPLPPASTWAEYEPALVATIRAIKKHDAQVLVVSLGLDTHEFDPVQERETAGMSLNYDDYEKMGALIAGCGVATVFVQEGGYNLEAAGSIVASVFRGMESGFCSANPERGESAETIATNVLAEITKSFPKRFVDQTKPDRGAPAVTYDDELESDDGDSDGDSEGEKTVSPVPASPLKSPKDPPKKHPGNTPGPAVSATPTKPTEPTKPEPKQKTKGGWFGF
jgi:acetoin utilization deacetylase AcuC-like enzyme|tara:strand:+ start:353 stop:1990 length:1638 start_codon:yes stop_codon:yes gene_type:complete